MCTFAEHLTIKQIVLNTELLYERLYHWYETDHRILPWRETTDPYRIWISEIILQQTRVAQGMEYYLRFVDRFPDVRTLAEASEDEVLRYWQGLGYYSRARNLHKAARQVVATVGSVGGVASTSGQTQDKEADVFKPTQDKEANMSGPTQDEIFKSLLSMPGVGEYTAGAIASFAFNLPYPALDGNVYRVLARLYDCDIAFDTGAGKRHFHAIANQLLDRKNPRLFNSAIMEFGALYCTPQSPDCSLCPLQAFCMAYAHHTVNVLPVRKPRTTLRDRYLNYTIYLSPDHRTLLHQRTENDIWKHLYEFVLVESDQLLPVVPDAETAQKDGDSSAVASVDITHILSHQRLHARFHIETVPALPNITGCIAVPFASLDDYALSRLTLKALEMLFGRKGV